MTMVNSAPYSSEQVSAWLRGLMTVAWADGHFDPEEQHLIDELVQQGVVPQGSQAGFDPISADGLAAGLGTDAQTGENFLRTAVMVALADGLYSSTEDQLLEKFAKALQVEVPALESLRLTLDGDHQPMKEANATQQDSEQDSDLLHPVRNWLDGMDIKDPQVARFLCQLIPAQCPFERNVVLFGKKIVHIPPLCKLNPLYEQLVGLRFRALSYLADDCEEDISAYM
ncbi:nitrogenase [Synechococcales cyanobacterium C]|uniref:Nitrogenase n=2 Tax=Petrachloros TaxID=2918834 RepID=A0A8K2A6K6_9CYAN|nr:Mo-dependent nitrogenase C-terminal domain-containing protein [Petrachloros mirabilis]NCJ05976.1 nitrogenase [Petrachloros mirabilis ULC683]